MVLAGPPARAPSRAMLSESKPRRAVSPLGIPKSPSFHSGLDLVAATGVKHPDSVSDLTRAFRFALLSDDGDMASEGPPQRAPDARSPPPPPPTAAMDSSPPDRENLMVQLPLLKGQSPILIVTMRYIYFNDM